MARLARLYVPGLPQLLVQRGNNRQQVFCDDTDRAQFILCLRDATREHHVALHAYVMLPDHFHLVATPADEAGMSKALQALGRRYVRWFNQRHARTGTLWEGRYRSTVMDPDRYLLAATRYVERNPVRAGLCTDAAAYRWSSARHHLGLTTDPMITDHAAFWALGNTPFERQAAYKALLDVDAQDAELQSIRTAMNQGWLLASGDMASAWWPMANRRPVARKRGRPTRGEASIDVSPIK
jgi:putative transposase